MINAEKLQNLREHICSFGNLLAAYREAAKNKWLRDEVITFSLNLEENLLELQMELLEQSYRCGNYREFYVRYPKPRLVMAISFRDRIVQHAIYRQLTPYLDKRFITHSYGCRVGKGTLAAAQCLLNWIQLFSRKPDAGDYVIFKGDISKYFYRVSHAVIMEIYREITEDSWFLWLIGSIICNELVPFGLPAGMDADKCPKEMRLFDVGMPIGNLTSQATANIYLDKLDKFCKFKLHIRYYVRYMDDFVLILRKEEAGKVMEEIKKFLKETLRLDLSPKSRILPLELGCEFVGYRVTPHGLRLRKRTTKHIKQALFSIAKQYRDGKISFEYAMASVISYLGMLEHCNGHNMKRWIAEHFVLKRGEKSEQSEACTASTAK